MWEGSVRTLWAWAKVKTRPSDAKRSRFGVVPRGFPSKPTASARSVSIVMSTTSRTAATRGPRRPHGCPAGPAESSKDAQERARREESRAALGRVYKRKGPPGIPGGPVRIRDRRLEGDADPEPHDARALCLDDRVEARSGSNAGSPVSRRVVSDEVVALENGPLVGYVENVDHRRDGHARRSGRSSRAADRARTRWAGGNRRVADRDVDLGVPSRVGLSGGCHT